MTLLEQLYAALQSSPCRCVYERSKGRPVFVKGERVLEKRCSRCAAIAAYQGALGASEAEPSPKDS